MIVYVVLKYKEGHVKEIEVYKSLSEAGKVRDQDKEHECVIKRKVIQ
jgi:hypothetical protein